MSIDSSSSMPRAVDRAVFQGELDGLRVREKAHTREGDAIAAARRRLPMVEVAADLPLVGQNGTVTLLDAFEGRTQLIAYYFMWHPGHPAPDQCEGCTWCNTHVAELAYVQSRDITYAVLCQGPYEESARYRDFMGWTMPWYSALLSLDTLLVGRTVGMMHIVCYLRDDDRVFETYWTTLRGVEAMDNSYGLMDLTVYGRQEAWEDSPPGWPQPWGAGAARIRTDGRPIAQWSRIEAGRSDDLAAER
ncbi:MAG: hypothetical protein QOK18_3311 [Mycobacterium sp.]|nr:hypothetical protein [Mycobacterium sp.]